MQSYALRAVAIIALVSWGVSLTAYTLQLQHSCAPLVPRSLPESCRPQVEANQPGLASRLSQWQDTLDLKRFSKAPPIDWTSFQPVKILPERFRQKIHLRTETAPAPASIKQPPNLSSQPNPSDQPLFDPSQIISHETIAIAVGSAALIGLAFIEVPIVVAAGVGVGIWYAARAIASAAF